MNPSKSMSRRSNKLIVAVLLLLKDYSKADETTWDASMYVAGSDDGTGEQFLWGPNIIASTDTGSSLCIESSNGSNFLELSNLWFTSQPTGIATDPHDRDGCIAACIAAADTLTGCEGFHYYPLEALKCYLIPSSGVL